MIFKRFLSIKSLPTKPIIPIKKKTKDTNSIVNISKFLYYSYKKIEFDLKMSYSKNQMK